MTRPYPFTLIKDKLAARHGQALDFAIGRRRIPLPEPIDTWIRSHADLALKPASKTEIAEFTDAAAALLKREYGADIPARCILPTPGGRAAMSAFVACALSPGDNVLVTEPGYPAFARLALHRHAQVHGIALQPDCDFVPDFSSALGADAKALSVIALNYPNNPTGAVLSPETLLSLRGADIAKTVLFNDATYGPLVYDQRPASLLGARMVGDSRVERIELHSFSKFFPLGPIAISFLAGSEMTMQDIATYSEFAWSPLSSLQVRGTTLCLRDAARLRELRELFPSLLEELHKTLIDVGFKPYTTPAGMYTICRVPAQIAGKAVLTAEEAAAHLMDEFDLAVVPWDTPGHGYLRFSSLYQPEDLVRLADLRTQLRLG